MAGEEPQPIESGEPGSPPDRETDDPAIPPTIPSDLEPREPPVLLDGGIWYLEAYRPVDSDETTRVPATERTAHGLVFGAGGGFFLRSECLRLHVSQYDYTGDALTTRTSGPQVVDGCPFPPDAHLVTNAATRSLRHTFRRSGKFALEWRGETMIVTNDEGARFGFRDARSAAFPEPVEVTLDLLDPKWSLESYRRADGGEVLVPASLEFPPGLGFSDPVTRQLTLDADCTLFGVDYAVNDTSLTVTSVFEEGLDCIYPSGAQGTEVAQAVDTLRRVFEEGTPLTLDRDEDRLTITAPTGEALVYRASRRVRLWRETSERLEIDVISGGDPTATPRATLAIERAALDAETLRLLASADYSIDVAPDPLPPCTAPVGNIHLARSIDASGEITTVVGTNACTASDGMPDENAPAIDGVIRPRRLAELAERIR